MIQIGYAKKAAGDRGHGVLQVFIARPRGPATQHSVPEDHLQAAGVDVRALPVLVAQESSEHACKAIPEASIIDGLPGVGRQPNDG